MLGAIAALLLTAAAPDGDQSASVGARLRESAAAAQALRGPMDGGWTLYDRHERALLALEITDPAGGEGLLEGAWRDLAGGGAAGPLGAASRQRGRLTIAFTPPDGAAPSILRLTRRGPRQWSGWLSEAGHARPVTLRPTTPAP